MSQMHRAVIPYESIDPLTIGAAENDELIYRDTLELDIPQANLLAEIRPDEPEAVADATAAAAHALEHPHSGPALQRAARERHERRHRDRQPVPADAAVAHPPGRLRCARGRRHRRRGRRVRERQGLPDVGVRHRAEDRQGQPRAHGAHGHPVLPERSAERGDVHVRRRLVPRHAGVAAQGGRPLRSQDHDRPGPVESLGRGRRRQADPPRRHLGRDRRVQPLRVRALAADALRRLPRADARRHRRGRDDVRPAVHDERAARHARPGDRHHLRQASRRPPRGDREVQLDLRLRASRRAGRHRDLRRLRADRSPLLPHGVGLHVGRLRAQGRRRDHLLQPVAGRAHGDRRLPRASL